MNVLLMLRISMLKALEKFVEAVSVPAVTIFNKDPSNHPYVLKFFNSNNAKAMLFVNVSTEKFESFQSKYHTAAVEYKDKGVIFLLGDLETSQGAFQLQDCFINPLDQIINMEDSGTSRENLTWTDAQTRRLQRR